MQEASISGAAIDRPLNNNKNEDKESSEKTTTTTTTTTTTKTTTSTTATASTTTTAGSKTSAAAKHPRLSAVRFFHFTFTFFNFTTLPDRSGGIKIKIKALLADLFSSRFSADIPSFFPRWPTTCVCLQELVCYYAHYRVSRINFDISNIPSS
jgi:hypothetical protein